MAQDRRIAAGLDIGSSKICCVITQEDESTGELKLIGTGAARSAGVKKGMIVDIPKAILAIESAVQAAEAMANVKIDRAFVGVSGDHVRSMNTHSAITVSHNGYHLAQEREITEADVQRVLDTTKAVSIPVDRDILHLLIQEYVVDTQGGIPNPVGMTGRRLEAKVHLVTASVSGIRNVTKCAEEAGVAVDAVVFHPLAAAAAVLEDHDAELGVVVVDIGAGTTSVAVFHEGTARHSAVISLGGWNVTNDIAQLLRISVENAEELKIRHGSALPHPGIPAREIPLPFSSTDGERTIPESQLVQFIEARMVELLQLVKREVARADVRTAVPPAVILTGGCALLSNLVPLAERILESRVKIGTARGLQGTAEAGSNPTYATAVGLIRFGLTHHGESRLGPRPFFRGWIQKTRDWLSDMF